MGLSIGGLGSGLDIGNMTEQLVAAERTPKLTRIQQSMSKVDNHLSAYGLIKSSASNFQEKLTEFKADDVFLGKSSTSSDSEFVSVSSTSDAQAGQYSIEVKQLAQKHKVASQFALDADPNASLGQGSLTLSLGNQSMTLNLDDKNSDLKSLVQSINQAEDNPGISATIITDEVGAKLVFSSQQSGKYQQIAIDASQATGDVQQLHFDPNISNSNMAEMQAAQDAQIVIDGYAIVNSKTNEFKDAIDGMTLDVKQLTDTEDTTSVTINIDNDHSQVKKAVSSFVNLYNSLVNMVESQSSFDAEANKAAPLVGDSASRSLISQLRNVLNESVTTESGKNRPLSDFGLSTDREGKLEIDQEQLTQRLDDDFMAASDFFTQGESGLVSRVTQGLDDFVGKQGVITNKETRLESQKSDFKEEIETLEQRMSVFEDRTYKQLSAMDAALSKMSQELNAMMSMFGFEGNG